MSKLIQTQYNVESSLDTTHSPLSLGNDNVRKNPQDYDLINNLQRQIQVLKQEIRKLHSRHRQLHSELDRLKSSKS